MIVLDITVVVISLLYIFIGLDQLGDILDVFVKSPQIGEYKTHRVIDFVGYTR